MNLTTAKYPGWNIANVSLGTLGPRTYRMTRPDRRCWIVVREDRNGKFYATVYRGDKCLIRNVT